MQLLHIAPHMVHAYASGRKPSNSPDNSEV